jgi:hypothetical protein
VVWALARGATERASGVPWAWTLLPIIPLGALVTIDYDHLSGRAKERREQRRERSQVVTLVRELVNRLGPDGIVLGSDEQVSAYLDGCFNKWWNEGLRERLLRRASLRRYGWGFASK